MRIWAIMNHPNIMPFTGYYLGPNLEVAYLISPYAPFGSVDKYLVKERVEASERLRLVCA